MGLQFTSKETIGAAARLPLALPIKDGLVAAYLTYNNQNQLKTNYADVVDDASIFGTPLITSFDTTFDGGLNSVDTQHLESSEFTYFSVLMPVDVQAGVNALVVGNFGTGVIGANLYITNTTASVSASIVGGYKGTNVAHNNKRCLVVARCSKDKMDISNKTQDKKTEVLLDNVQRQQNGKTIKIGSSYETALMKGRVSVSVVVIYDRALSDIEVDAVCSVIRRVTKSIGIDV